MLIVQCMCNLLGYRKKFFDLFSCSHHTTIKHNALNEKFNYDNRILRESIVFPKSNVMVKYKKVILSFTFEKSLASLGQNVVTILKIVSFIMELLVWMRVIT